ncbi:flagellar basal body L-ring protein FlgH [Echinimonas agarilytica]|uniref:Flagellar L-ring protein n=1 Tax=Echinimonas agarilytica TaxID=1215918 RepID=A0AA42B6X1_9GAMM|nr:flagellar basal body L-ring protein FlgH [Echinimonas agarilytica]MCM2678941.1 flagellar basal body L-ring protein FlgH [Echinimonas agarilytica]
MKRLMIMSALVVAGCGATQKPIQDDPYYAPVFPEMQTNPVIASGSLFQSEYAQNLYSDIKAHRVGDIITVELTESTTAKKQAKTEIDKDSGVSLTTPVLMNSPITYKDQEINASINMANSFSGESDADQSNSLQGSISVHVVQVMANGNLVVRGEKWITLNNGDEFIRLSGIIRPEDISTENSISSTRVANARIQYAGTGAFADAQEQGWFSAFFNNPLFPF